MVVMMMVCDDDDDDLVMVLQIHPQTIRPPVKQWTEFTHAIRSSTIYCLPKAIQAYTLRLQDA